jgi:hypothetical protein
MGDWFLGEFLRNKGEDQNFLGYFFTMCRLCMTLTKMGCATFWAIFSQTHLVTLQFVAAARVVGKYFRYKYLRTQ